MPSAANILWAVRKEGPIFSELQGAGTVRPSKGPSSGCHLLSGALLFSLFFDIVDNGDVSPKRRLSSNGPHGVVS
jgi:hypothetical protein